MRLDKVISDSGCHIVKGSGLENVLAVVDDSRKVTSGSLFIAVKGFASDGHDYIAKAVGLGASAIVYENGSKLEAQLEGVAHDGVALIKTDSSRHALAVIAANFYDNPSEKLTLVGITGTNGKTTTVTLLHRMFTAMPPTKIGTNSIPIFWIQ